VTTFQQQHPGTWREAQPPNRDVADGWDARIRLIDDQTALQQEMDSLAEQFSSAERASVLEQYAFTQLIRSPSPIRRQIFFTGAGCTSSGIGGFCGSQARY
jgi:hypothetical protein